MRAAICWSLAGWDCFGDAFGRPTRDVVVRRVTAVYSRAAGVAIGSEMSGGMQNITVSDCDSPTPRPGSTLSTRRPVAATSGTVSDPVSVRAHVFTPARPDPGLTAAELPFRGTQNVRTGVNLG